MTTISSKKAIVSFANERGNYIHGLARLGESLRNNFDGDFLGFIGEGTVGVKPHLEDNYAFKIRCTEIAAQNYTQILWLDASCFAIKNVQPIFEEMAETGFIFQDSGHSVGTWTNDRTLKYFGVSRDEAMNLRLMGNAGFLGIDLSHKTAKQFLKKYSAAMEAGLFNGKWTNDEHTESEDDRCKGHRHDISVASLILHQLGVLDQMKRGDEWLQYAGPYDATANETIIIKARGL